MAIDVTADDEHARAFLKEKGITFPSLSGKWDVTGKAYGVDSTPTAIVVDQQGRLLFRHHGFNSSAGMAPVTAMLDAALSRGK